MIGRRAFVTALGASVVVGASAQATRRPRIVWLSLDPAEANGGFRAFQKGLRELGYVDGRDITIETVLFDVAPEDQKRLAAGVVQSRPAIIVTQGPVVRAIRATGTTIPVVFGFSGDPIVAGLVKSLARPGTNYTGVSFLSLDLVGKRMEMLREIVPGLRRVAIIANPDHPGELSEKAVSSDAAKRLGLVVDYFPVSTPEQLEEALAGTRKAGSGAILLFPDAGMMRNAARIAEFGRQQRIPAISGWAIFARRGNVASYGPILEVGYGRLSWYVDRILKGTPPAELPVELPTKVEFVINASAARDIQLTIPAAVMLRADEVIQ
ncbi:MAG: ABC transporter substrate-binding protein [Burkholderiales bacterium]